MADNTLADSKRKRGLLALAIAVLVVLGLAGLIRSFQSPEQASDAPAQATVQITADGFVPANLRISRGTDVEWTNADNKPHKVASNPHPDHTDVEGLESPELQPGQTYRYTFQNNGTFGYHDHLNPTVNSTVMVE